MGDPRGVVAVLKDTLLKQFSACYDENHWFVAVKNAVAGVTAEQAEWKPHGAQYSIRELLSHLNHDVNACLKRFQGIEYESRVTSNDETFDLVGGTWEADLEQFETTMTQWRDLLESIDESKLGEPMPPRNELARIEIANMNSHNAYHGGQIVLLRKLQESWDPQKGVS